MADANISSILATLTAITTTLHKIEVSFDERRVIPWMRSHWHWSFYYSIIYLFLIFLGQKIMQDRKPYNLRVALCCWSAGLCLFSCYATFRIVPKAYNMVYLGGFQHAICDIGSYSGSGGGGIWSFLFPFSKLPELVDTLFIVLRKKKMVFLHWYHHVTVFIYCWFSYAFPISTGIWFGTVNYSVHAIMYGYYAIKASGRTPPKLLAKSVTTIQLSQMFVGIMLNYLAIKSLSENKTCEMNTFAISISIFFYTSYAILFGNFYYWTYISKKTRKPTAKNTGAALSNGTALSNGVALTNATTLTNGSLLSNDTGLCNGTSCEHVPHANGNTRGTDHHINGFTLHSKIKSN